MITSLRIRVCLVLNSFIAFCAIGGGVCYGVKPYLGVFNESRFSVPRADHPFRAQDPFENNGGESTKKNGRCEKKSGSRCVNRSFLALCETLTVLLSDRYEDAFIAPRIPITAVTFVSNVNLMPVLST